MLAEQTHALKYQERFDTPFSYVSLLTWFHIVHKYAVDAPS